MSKTVEIMRKASDMLFDLDRDMSAGAVFSAAQRQEAIDAATRKLVEACEFVVSTNEPCDERMAEMQRIAKLNNLRAALAELKEASK